MQVITTSRNIITCRYITTSRYITTCRHITTFRYITTCRYTTISRYYTLLPINLLISLLPAPQLDVKRTIWKGLKV